MPDIRRMLETVSWYESAGQYQLACEVYPSAVDAGAGTPDLLRRYAWALQCLGRDQDAEGLLRSALASAPRDSACRREYALLLFRTGRLAEAREVWGEGPDVPDADPEWLSRLVSDSMRSTDLRLATSLAEVLAELRWKPGATCFGRSAEQLGLRRPEPMLSLQKLRHDAEQVAFLVREERVSRDFGERAIAAYSEAAAIVEARGEEARLSLADAAVSGLSDIYARLVHKGDGARVPGSVFSGSWDPWQVEELYLANPPGLVVVDNFLSAEALTRLRSFCLESTVWNGNRYAHGRLGAFFHDGFSAPLLAQIAEEIRFSFPRIVGAESPLRQLWGFKNQLGLARNSTIHADFAAINVNLWITPTGANLDRESGGLVVYGLDAPPHWDFDTYNGKLDVIRSFILQQRAGHVTVPYRQNRALIFNSDLFHCTDSVSFADGFENRRVNVTFLYGERHQDRHYMGVGQSSHELRPAWRSATLRRGRR